MKCYNCASLYPGEPVAKFCYSCDNKMHENINIQHTKEVIPYSGFFKFFLYLFNEFFQKCFKQRVMLIKILVCQFNKYLLRNNHNNSLNNHNNNIILVILINFH